MFRTAIALIVLAMLAGCHSTHPPTTAPAAQTNSAADKKLWSLLRTGGQVVMMRHAKTTPGSGDPPNFKLGDCSTQRNLSDEGRAQARAIGEAFKQHGVVFADVRSSQYCRCLDTARLIAGRATEEPALNAVFDDTPERGEQIRRMMSLASSLPHRHNTLLVTHQTNIAALVQVTPELGDIVILTPDGKGGFHLAGKLHVAD